MRAAVIDIGSNTAKLVIGEKTGDGVTILESLKNATNLGKGTFFRTRISQDMIKQVTGVLGKYRDVVKQYDVQEVRVIATTAVREAGNRDIFLDTVRRRTGFNIEVLNVGDVVYYIDSFLSYKLKKTYPIQERNLLIVELGAGGIDVSVMENGFTLMNFGLPAGTLRLKQFKSKLDGSFDETNEALREYVENQIFSISREFPDFPIDDVILIDESYASALQAVIPNKKRGSDFFKLSLRETERFWAKVSGKNLDTIFEEFALPADIADSLDTYAIVLMSLFRLSKNRSVHILPTSLSEALLTNTLLGFELSEKYNKANQLLSAANFLCRKYNLGVKHAKAVVQISEQFFRQFKEPLGLQDEDLLYLQLAAYLHDLGAFVSNRAHHKHTEYIINALNFFRLTDQEIKMIACIARYHRKSTPAPAHLVYGSLPPDKQIKVQKLSSLLRMANALDSAHKQKVRKLEFKTGRNDDVTLTVLTKDNFVLEKANFLERKALFEEISGSRISLNVKKAG